MANINDAFRVEGLSLDDTVGIFQGSNDPSAGVGEAAPIGSLFLRTTGNVYKKTGAADLDWSELAAGAGVVNINDLGDVSVTTPTTGQILVFNAATGDWENIDNPATVGFTYMKEPTGFPNRTDSQVTVNEVTRTITIAPVAASFDYYIWGTQYTVTTPINGTFPDTQGMHYLYLDSAGIVQVQTGGFTPTLLTDYAYICNLYWDVATQSAIVIGDERHGLTMDHATHLHFHNTLGTQFISGLALNTVVPDGTGALETEAQFGVDNGLIRDEDIDLNIIHSATGFDPTTIELEQFLNAPAQLPIFYRLGANGDWKKKTADDFPLIYSGTAGYTDPANQLPAWNEWTGTVWQLTPVANNHYVLVHYIATNDMRHPVIGIQGLTDYQNKPQGVEAGNVELSSLAGLPFQEFTPIGTAIYECRDVWTNTPKAIIRTTDAGADYVDWREIDQFSSLLGGGGLNDHGNLSGLNDDDHLHYHTDTRADTWLTAKQVTVAGNPSPAQDQLILALPDSARGKDLSVETQTYHFTETTISPLEWIQVGSAADALSGITVPLNGTVIRATGHCAETGGNTKSIDLYINGVNTATIGTITGVGEQTFADNTLNIDIAAGDKIRLRGGAEAGNIQDTVITLYIKWRA